MFSAMSPHTPRGVPALPHVQSEAVAQLSAQCHKTVPYPCLPGASRSCLSAQCHSWALGNRRKAAGCGGTQARQPMVLINKAHGHELRGAQHPLGRGQRAGHGSSEQQGWKIPVKPGTHLICAKGKCVHWFLSSIGWQWNLGTEQLCRFQLRERSAAGAASASQSRCWLWSMDPIHFWGLPPVGLLPCLPPGEGHHLHHAPQISVSGQQCLAALTEGFSTLEFASPLVWQSSHLLSYRTQHPALFFFFLSHALCFKVLPVKNCRLQFAL